MPILLANLVVLLSWVDSLPMGSEDFDVYDAILSLPCTEHFEPLSTGQLDTESCVVPLSNPISPLWKAPSNFALVASQSTLSLE